MIKENIWATVRIRPLLSHEEGENLSVKPPTNRRKVQLMDEDGKNQKDFNLNHTFWSLETEKTKIIDDNAKVFDRLGKAIIINMESGFNSTIFAYGQTGTGKSFSIEGTNADHGILQRLCDSIFDYKKDVESKNDRNAMDIDVSYLELYNENLRDLLDSAPKKMKIYPLKKEVIVKNLTKIPCDSFEEVNDLFNQGKKIRVVGSTSMNKQSSRSHAVFTLYVRIETHSGDKKKKIKKAKIHLVDLAGSERADKTKAKGKRLKEGSNINKSLTFLGIVIEKLAKGSGKKGTHHIPYRNSELTKLLSHSLGGNSKTIMLAAISPAASNYHESKSTLMFAERCATISNDNLADVVEMNEDSEDDDDEADLRKRLAEVEKAIAKRKEEIKDEDSDAKLNELKAERERILAEINETQEVLGRERESKEDKLEKKKALEAARNKALEDAGMSTGKEEEKRDPNTPYLANIADDPSLVGMITIYISDGSHNIGSDPQGGVKVAGLGINPIHSVATNQGNDKVTITGDDKNRVLVNGNAINGTKELFHKDRVVLGHGNAFEINIPKHPEKANNKGGAQFGAIMNDRLQSDTAEARNIKMYLQNLEKRLGKGRVNKFVSLFAQMLDWIDEANQYTKFRYENDPSPDKDIYFSLEIMTDILEFTQDEPEFAVRMRRRSDDQVLYLWDFAKFKGRVEMMAEWYEAKKDGDNADKNGDEDFPNDPWVEDPTAEEEDEQRSMIIETLKNRHDRLEKIIAEKQKSGDSSDLSDFKQQRDKIHDQIKQFEGEEDDADDTTGSDNELDDLQDKINILEKHNKAFDSDLKVVQERIKSAKENMNEDEKEESSKCNIF